MRCGVSRAQELCTCSHPSLAGIDIAQLSFFGIAPAYAVPCCELTRPRLCKWSIYYFPRHVVHKLLCMQGALFGLGANVGDLEPHCLLSTLHSRK